MRKLFYIVLTIVILMVGGRYIKEQNKSNLQATSPISEVSEPITATLPDVALSDAPEETCVCDPETSCEADDTECLSLPNKEICTCPQSEAKAEPTEETDSQTETIAEEVQHTPDEATTKEAPETLVKSDVSVATQPVQK